MARFIPMSDRHMVPRWRSFAETTTLGELGRQSHTQAHRAMGARTLATRINEWRTQRTIGHASDLLGVAIVVGNRGTDVMEAAELLTSDVSDAPTLARALGNAVLSGTAHAVGHADASEHTVRAHIRTLKEWTRQEPRDAIAWVDLARMYCLVGHISGSKKCMDVAVGIAPNNRFVLRCAGRFWLHVGDPEKGYGCLVKGLVTANRDPWLMAAGIALSDTVNRRSPLLSRADRMLDDPRYSPKDVSELAAEMATRDSRAHKVGRAKKRFRQALEMPTENTLAQVAWVAQGGSRAVKSDIVAILTDDAFEAKAQHYFYSGEWRQTIIECEKWACDEPYRSHPAIKGSYVAAVGLSDYVECDRLATAGLRANPANFALLNNKAFACAHLRDFGTARRILGYLEKSRLSEEERSVFLATSGLVAYRTGNINKGRELYREALKKLEARIRSAGRDAPDVDRESYGQVTVNWIREELTAAGGLDVAVLERATGVMRPVKGPVSQLIRDRLSELAETGRSA